MKIIRISLHNIKEVEDIDKTADTLKESILKYKPELLKALVIGVVKGEDGVSFGLMIATNLTPEKIVFVIQHLFPQHENMTGSIMTEDKERVDEFIEKYS